MVPSGINVPPGKFAKNNNSTPWNNLTAWNPMANREMRDLFSPEQPQLTYLCPQEISKASMKAFQA